MKTLKTKSQLWTAFGGAMLLGSVMLGGYDLYELQTFTTTPPEQAMRIQGVLSANHKTLTVSGKSGAVLSCPVGWCRYPGMSEDIGMHRAFWLADGRIIQVERNGQLVDVRELQRASKLNRVLLSMAGIALSVLCFVCAYRQRERPIISA